jgi:hypothetical protein
VLRVLAWGVLLAVVFFFGGLFPEWGDFNDWATFLFVPLLLLNLCFGAEGGDWLEKGWKFSAIILTIAIYFFEPISAYGYGTKMACSIVVVLTLLYAIFGRTTMDSEFFPIVYDILFWLSIPVCWVIAWFVPEVTLCFKLPINDNVLYVPYELALYIIAWLRYGPLFTLFDGPLEKTPSKVKVDDRCCRNCAYLMQRRASSGATFPHCTCHHKDIGALEIYSKCNNYARRKL